MRTGAAVLALGLAGCAVPYQPASTTAPLPVPEQKLLEVFVRHFPTLELHGRDPLLLRSAWTNDEDPSVAVQRRGHLTVTPDPAGGVATIDVVVQRRMLRTRPFSLPAWIEGGGDRRLEDRILEEIDAVVRPEEVSRSPQSAPFAPTTSGQTTKNSPLPSRFTSRTW